jgi:hypothetical protein
MSLGNPNDATPYYALNQRIDKFEERVWAALNELIKSNAELTATLKHPDPRHCTKVQFAAAIEERMKLVESRVSDIELTKAQMTGGGKVAQWIINILIALVGIAIGIIAKLKGGVTP